MSLKIYFFSLAWLLSLTSVGQINPDSCKIEVPAVFTPDNSGRITLGKHILNCNLREFEFSIFNRWGEVMYETKDKNEVNGLKWDLKKVKVGVYYWILKYTISLEEPKSVQGYSTYMN